MWESPLNTFMIVNTENKVFRIENQILALLNVIMVNFKPWFLYLETMTVIAFHGTIVMDG